MINIINIVIIIINNIIILIIDIFNIILRTIQMCIVDFTIIFKNTL